MIPKVKFYKTDLETNIDIVKISLENRDNNLHSDDQTYKIFPELINESVEVVVEKALIERDKELSDIVNHYQKIWNKYNDDFMIALSDVLNINWPNGYKDIFVSVGIYPLCTRDLPKKAFHLSYWLSDENILDAVPHECCHLLYFEKWKELFPNYDSVTFDPPHIIWRLSEMVVDFILNNSIIQGVIPHQFKAYPFFYEDNMEEMNDIREIYQNNSIEDAIKLSYQYLLDKENNKNKEE